MLGTQLAVIIRCGVVDLQICRQCASAKLNSPDNRAKLDKLVNLLHIASHLL